MSRVMAQNGFEGLIFVIMAVLWAVVQVLNRAGRRSGGSTKRTPEKPGREPAKAPSTKPTAPPENDLRRFLEELAGVEPEEEPKTPPPLPQHEPAAASAGQRRPPPAAPARQPAPAPMRAPVLARDQATQATSPPKEYRPKPKPFVPRAVSRRPEKKIALRVEDSGADILESFPHSSSGPLNISMPALPTIRISGSAGLSLASPGRRSGQKVLRTGNRSELRRAVLMSAILGAPRAIARVGSDLPYGDSV